MTTDFEKAVKAQGAASLAQLRMHGPVAEDASQASNFRFYSFDFAQLSTPKGVTAKGSQLIFLRRGSFPGARLNLKVGGSTFPGFRPGCRIAAPFTDFQLERATSYGNQLYVANIGASRQIQPINFMVVGPGCDYLEPSPLVETDGRLWPLLGDTQTLSTGSWTLLSVGLAGDVGGGVASSYWAGDISWFNPYGFKKLRIYIDGGSSNTMQSCTLVPWIRQPWGASDSPSSRLTLRMPLAAISVNSPIYSDTAYASVASYQFTVLDIDNPLFSHKDLVPQPSGFTENLVAGAGAEMAFQLVDLVGGGTGVRLAVDGIETP